MLTDAFANTVVMRSIALSGLALLVCACTTKPGYYPVSEVLPEGDPRWNGCQIMLYPVDEPGVRAGSRFGRDGKKIACNTPPKSLAGPTEAVPIGSGITFNRRPFQPTEVNRIIDECFANFKQVLAANKAMEKYGYKYEAGVGYQMSEENWNAIPADAQRWMIWKVAISHACTSLKPVTIKVRVWDERGRVFREQRVSTEFRCARDLPRLRRNRETWYRC